MRITRDQIGDRPAGTAGRLAGVMAYLIALRRVDVVAGTDMIIGVSPLAWIEFAAGFMLELP